VSTVVCVISNVTLNGRDALRLRLSAYRDVCFLYALITLSDITHLLDRCVWSAVYNLTRLSMTSAPLFGNPILICDLRLKVRTERRNWTDQWAIRNALLLAHWSFQLCSVTSLALYESLVVCGRSTPSRGYAFALTGVVYGIFNRFLICVMKTIQQLRIVKILLNLTTNWRSPKIKRHVRFEQDVQSWYSTCYCWMYSFIVWRCIYFIFVLIPVIR